MPPLCFHQFVCFIPDLALICGWFWLQPHEIEVFLLPFPPTVYRNWSRVWPRLTLYVSADRRSIQPQGGMDVYEFSITSRVATDGTHHLSIWKETNVRSEGRIMWLTHVSRTLITTNVINPDLKYCAGVVWHIYLLFIHFISIHDYSAANHSKRSSI